MGETKYDYHDSIGAIPCWLNTPTWYFIVHQSFCTQNSILHAIDIPDCWVLETWLPYVWGKTGWIRPRYKCMMDVLLLRESQFPVRQAGIGGPMVLYTIDYDHTWGFAARFWILGIFSFLEFWTATKHRPPEAPIYLCLEIADLRPEKSDLCLGHSGF